MSSTSLLELRSLVFGYDENYPILKNISLSIYPGERIAVLGNNGAGKSTFFLCCNGVLKPMSGTLSLDGKEISYSKQDLTLLRKSVGLVFQDPDDQIIASTVEAEVSFGPLNLGLSTSETQTSVDQAIKVMDLEDFRNRPPHYLSGGEKKRVTIADILAMQSRMLLFDEPTSSLDPQNTRRFQQTLSDLSDSGMTLVVATHDIDFAYAWAKRVLVFSQGELLADGTPLSVFSNDQLLETAGLKKPLLYEVTEALSAYSGSATFEKPLQSVKEIPQLMKELKL